MTLSSSFTPLLPFLTPSHLSPLYQLGPELGRGQFGIICRCTHSPSGMLLACKSISKLLLRAPSDIQNIVREISIMKHLCHHIPPYVSPALCNPLPPCCDNIVQLYDIVEDEESIHLIVELCQGGELFNRIAKRCYSEKQAAFLMKDLLETLQFCHSMGVIHRDIKPENILLVNDSDTSRIKLADFGLALEFSPGQKFSSIAGSIYYMAPEMLRGEYSEEIDMWSAGVTLYVMLSGMAPFWASTEEGVFKAIKKGNLNFPPDPWGSITACAKDLICQMLSPDAESRLTPAQALKHPWILHHTRKVKQVPRALAYDLNGERRRKGCGRSN